jgi:hypothetical protein
MDPWWMTPLRSLVDGRRVILAGGVAAGWTEHIAVLRAAGAAEIMVVATEGAGAGPSPDATTVVVDPPDGLSMMDRIHHAGRVLEQPPGAVSAAIAAFDPAGTAVVIGTFLNTTATLDGRPFVSFRRPEWLALEDKVVVDAFWDRAGVARLPSIVVPVNDAAAAAPSVDLGRGTVWAADARDGFHGGAEGTRWVAGPAGAARATADLGARSDRVRIMPFVEGVPASVHGIVLPDGVAVLRPVEMVVLRRSIDGSDERQLWYAGCATFWDPPPSVRDQMVAVARATGARLAAEVEFRGTFTVDGVVADDGFWPTEVNPRFGAGIVTIARAGGDVPIVLLNELMSGGHRIGRSAAEVEREFVEVADARRGGGTWKGGFTTDRELDAQPAVHEADGWRWAEPGEAPSGHVTAGAGFVRCRYVAEATPVGPPTALRAAQFWGFADRELGLGIGPLGVPLTPPVTMPGR